jgi:hypothetical protein
MLLPIHLSELIPLDTPLFVAIGAFLLLILMIILILWQRYRDRGRGEIVQTRTGEQPEEPVGGEVEHGASDDQDARDTPSSPSSRRVDSGQQAWIIAREMFLREEAQRLEAAREEGKAAGEEAPPREEGRQEVEPDRPPRGEPGEEPAGPDATIDQEAKRAVQERDHVEEIPLPGGQEPPADEKAKEDPDESNRPAVKQSWLSVTREALDEAARRDEQDAVFRAKEHQAKKLATLSAMLAKPTDKDSGET